MNVSSIAGLRAVPDTLAYAMSKAALDQFTRCTALELAGRGVRVNSVNPALIVTDFHFNLGMKQEDYVKFVELLSTLHPVGRVGQATEVVSAIAFLAKDDAGFVTGVCLPIDGGMNVGGLTIPIPHEKRS